MPLNNSFFPTNLKNLRNNVTRNFFGVGAWFCIVLNLYNKKKKLAGASYSFYTIRQINIDLKVGYT
ncbi:hypothetical protein TSAR_012063 [Trichomalopsis sarcophagae]|uniref:Uncharacterized protein n=1 Tax=Trichomalopsis sarcophagae TaxID=543379 RepID=A0A232EL35_9HYME|nr:hypothetical protein TSAR_012063 [Trichomalopsis sarcophagae]